MDEVKSRFGSFQSTDRRPHLFVKLAEFVAALRRVPISGFLIIDGSFVTQEPQPNDIDLILVLPSGWQLEAELSPAEYNVLSSKSAKRLWGIDLLVACDGTKEYAEYVALFNECATAEMSARACCE